MWVYTHDQNYSEYYYISYMLLIVSLLMDVARCAISGSFYISPRSNDSFVDVVNMVKFFTGVWYVMNMIVIDKLKLLVL